MCGERCRQNGRTITFCLCLKRFPLVHQVPDLPHQGLMAVDDRLGRLVVLVEARGRHRGFELLDARLGLCDSGLELLDPPLPGFGLLLDASGLLRPAFFLSSYEAGFGVGGLRCSMARGQVCFGA